MGIASACFALFVSIPYFYNKYFSAPEATRVEPSGLEQLMLDRRARAYPSDRYEIIQNDSIHEPIRVRELPQNVDTDSGSTDVKDNEVDPIKFGQIAAERKELVESIKDLQEDIAIDKAQLEADPSDYATREALLERELLLIDFKAKLQALRDESRKQ